MFGKQKVAALVAEFLGTGALTLLILSVQRSTIGVPFFVATAAGLTVALMFFAVGATSGGYFNPALTLGFWTTRKVQTVTALVYLAAQLLGAWAAYGIYTYYVKNSLQPIGGHFTGRIFVGELLGTAIFGFGVAAAVYQKVSQAAAAAYVGLSLMLGAIAASTVSLGLLNPAVALGVRAWIPFGTGVEGWATYVLGPIVGALIGINLYALLFANNGGSVLSSLATATAGTTTKKNGKKSKK